MMEINANIQMALFGFSPVSDHFDIIFDVIQNSAEFLFYFLRFSLILMA